MSPLSQIPHRQRAFLMILNLHLEFPVYALQTSTFSSRIMQNSQGLMVSHTLFPQVILPFRKIYAYLSKAARFLSLFLSTSLSSLSTP